MNLIGSRVVRSDNVPEYLTENYKYLINSTTKYV